MIPLDDIAEAPAQTSNSAKIVICTRWQSARSRKDAALRLPLFAWSSSQTGHWVGEFAMPTPPDDSSGDQACETAGHNVCASALGGWTNTATDNAPSTAIAPANAKALVNEPLASTI